MVWMIFAAKFLGCFIWLSVTAIMRIARESGINMYHAPSNEAEKNLVLNVKNTRNNFNVASPFSPFR
jgi:hypothetical protein